MGLKEFSRVEKALVEITDDDPIRLGFGAREQGKSSVANPGE